MADNRKPSSANVGLKETLKAYGIKFADLGMAQKQMFSRQEAFLVAYAVQGTILKAAPAAGITREAVRLWIKQDALSFKARFEATNHAFRERLQGLALSRVEEPQGNRGSDVLFLGLLNANWPEKYRQNISVTDTTAQDVMRAWKKYNRERRSVVVEPPESPDGPGVKRKALSEGEGR